MRNLFAFIWRNHNIFLFFLLESVCVFFIVQNNNYQRSSFINSSNAAAASVYHVFSGITDYFSLKSANERLVGENALLRSRMKYSFSEYNRGFYRIDNTVYRQQYQYIAGKVVNNSFTRRNNYFTMAIGASQGVRDGMGVISTQGIAGIVKSVSSDYSTVMSLLHKNMRISVKIKKNNYFGSLIWEGKNYRQATLLEVPKHVPLAEGDTVITSGYSTLFPEGVPVGTIAAFQKDAEDNFYIISINLSTDFGNMQHAYVVVNLFGSEQKELEIKSEND